MTKLIRLQTKLCMILVAGSAFDCGPARLEVPTPSMRLPAEACVEPTGLGTTHEGEIGADELWSASDSPHIVTRNLTLRAATLTIEPCAVVRVREGYSITIVGDDVTAARLVAHGEAIINDDGTTTVRPVMIVPHEPNTFWGSLLVQSNGMVDLEYVNLRRGGAHATAANLGGTIVAGGSGPLTRNVRAVSVLIEDSEGFGVNLQTGAGFTADSRDLTIRGSGQSPSLTNYVTGYPLFVAPPALQSIPSGNYFGNAIDKVEVFGVGFSFDETFRSIGVPYHLDGGFDMIPNETVADGGLLTLTIEAGVTIEMGRDQYFSLGASNGSLPENIWPVRVIAAGTEEQPIVFTSESPTPIAGDWVALYWAGGAETGNVMRHVLIDYAGGDSGTGNFGCGPGDNDAALIFTNWVPGEDFIDDLTIAHSANGGIISGWSTDGDGPNFKDGNTFTNMGSDCVVSRWSNVSAPVCPGNDNVPDCL